MTEPRIETSGQVEGSDPALAEQIELAFRPLHKRALGIGIGVAAGLAVAAATIVVLLRQAEGTARLGLLAQYFAGYEVSWTGALIGAAWAGFVGFVAGWFYAFCRNLVLATIAFLARTRADLSGTRDFLDHI